MSKISRSVRILAGVAPLALALAGCAENFDARVSRYSAALPAPAGQTFAVLPANPRDQGSLEFAHFADSVTAHLSRVGYVPAAPGNADLIVHFGYGIDGGKQRVRSYGPSYDPFWSPWYGGGFGGYRGGFYRGGFGGGWAGSGFYRHGAWGYGWYDPFFWDQSNIDVTTVYTSGIDLSIERRDGHRVFEGKAEAASTSRNVGYLVPNLIEAMFTNFPGNSGQTVRISIAPEKQAVRR